MKRETLLVLEEGSCPFLDGPEGSCCLSALVPLR
jgi:hypothetical protein